VDIPAMDKAVAQLDIERHRKLLSTETEPSKRATLARRRGGEAGRADRQCRPPGSSPQSRVGIPVL